MSDVLKANVTSDHFGNARPHLPDPYLGVLEAVTRASAGPGPLQDLMDLVRVEMKSIVDLDRTGLLLANEETSRALAVAGPGTLNLAEPDEILPRLRRIAKGQRAFYCNDCSADPEFDELVGGSPGERSLLAVVVPLGKGRAGAAWGVRDSIGGFDENDAAWLYAFTRQALAWAMIRQLTFEGDRARERLQRLHATGKNIAQSLELETILPQIVVDATNLLGATSGDMLLLDESRSVLMVVGISNLPEDMLNFEMPFGEGVSSRAMDSRRPIAVSDYPNYPHRARHLDAHAFKAVLSVPLVSRGKAIGAINVHRDQPGYRFEEDEIDLLVAFADHAAVAIDTAQRYENEKALADHLRNLNSAIERRNADLSRALEVQNRLTQKVLSNQGLNAIVTELADLLERPVQVYDHLLHLLSSAKVDRPGPQLGERREEEEFAALLDEVVERKTALPLPGEERSLLAPLLAGPHVLGYLNVLDTADLREIDVALVNLAITSLSLELMKIQTEVEAEHRVRGDLVLDLIHGTTKSAELIKARASYLGYSLDDPYNLLLLVPYVSDKARHDDSLHKRLRDFVHREIVESTAGGIVAEVSQGVVVLLPAADEESDPLRTATRLDRSISHRFSSSLITVAVSTRCEQPTDFPAAFRLADDTIQAIHKLSAGGVIDARDQRLFRLLLKASSQEDLLEYSNAVLAPIREHDNDRGGSLEETLRLYVDNGCSQRKAASAGYLHPNTVAYRLRKIEQIMGRGLDSAETILELQLALKISDLMPDAHWSTARSGG